MRLAECPQLCILLPVLSLLSFPATCCASDSLSLVVCVCVCGAAGWGRHYYGGTMVPTSLLVIQSKTVTWQHVVDERVLTLHFVP